MSAYLEGYGAGEEQRERLIKRVLIGIVIVIAAAAGLYFVLRNYKEQQQAKKFYEYLRAKQYKEAYALWGCTDAKPCRDYPWDQFMGDWGPNSPHADMSKFSVASTKSCDGGYLEVLQWGGKDEVILWVNRADLTLSYSPWGAPVCSPHFRPNTKGGAQ
jgi:hypothetical protein